MFIIEEGWRDGGMEGGRDDIRLYCSIFTNKMSPPSPSDYIANYMIVLPFLFSTMFSNNIDKIFSFQMLWI